MCALCGLRVKDIDTKKKTLLNNTGPIDPTRQNHSGIRVTVIGGKNIVLTQEEARKDAELITERLLSTRKLALVLDLDHTLLHATHDRRVHEFGWDMTCPDVQTIYLQEAQKKGKPPSPHYLKLRPGLGAMLQELHECYQLYIYTHGTRQYAEAVAKAVDPNNIYFQGRIISRTDNPTGMNHKMLSQLFPFDDSMALILDDRTDVWPSNQGNLLKVKPYYFFHQMAEVNNAAGDAIIGNQSKPVHPATMHSDQDGSIANAPRPVPKEDDDELGHIGRVLKEIHQVFYNGSSKDLSVDAQLSGKGPDVKAILKQIRTSVFQNVRIVFSAMIPRTQNVKPNDHPTWRQTEAFGACVSSSVEKGVTHVVARNPGTDKTMEAMNYGIWVVNPKWLERSISTWKRAPENDYIFPQLEGHRRGKPEAGSAKFLPPVLASANGAPAELSSVSTKAVGFEDDSSESEVDSDDERAIAELDAFLLG